MDFEITPDQQELIDSVRSVLARECPTALVRDIVENGSAPEQPWKSARELGWTGVDLPETLGGLELGFTALGLVIEQHGCCVAPGPFLATVTQFLSLVCEAGTPDRSSASRCQRGPAS
jgi:alkylation response protein AidB-like acyl-CoA dehydrogenase